LIALGGSAVAAAAAWFVGNAIYSKGVEPFSWNRQAVGWAMGLVGLGLPWIALRSYALWLRAQRRTVGDIEAVRWLKAAVGICAAVWVAYFLFSVFLARDALSLILALVAGALIGVTPIVISYIREWSR
jgi:hypothetical protein